MPIADAYFLNVDLYLLAQFERGVYCG